MTDSIDAKLFENTEKIQELAELCEKNNDIDKELFAKYKVNRGLRDLNGKGVLAGLTNISDVCAKKIVNGEEVPCAKNDRGLRRLHICCCLENCQAYRRKKNSGCFWRKEDLCRPTLCGM